MVTTIHTVSSLCGAGKTHAAIHFACAQAETGHKFLFTAPTVDLVRQIANDFRIANSNIQITAIHSLDAHEAAVSGRITEHFENATADQGEILVVTQAGFERTKHFPNRGRWHLIVDEPPSPIYHENISLHENHHRLLELLHETPHNAEYMHLSASEVESDRVYDVARNRHRDKITAQLSEIANKLVSDHWSCFATNDQINRFRNPRHDTANALDFFALLQPGIYAGFASVTLMGACFEESLLYAYWSSIGVEFAPHKRITTRYDRHPNGKLVTIQYAIDRDWSATLRDRQFDGETLMDNIVRRCTAAMNGKPYVYLVNKSQKIKELADGVQLPQVSHGRNDFLSYHNAMLLSALNPPPAYFRFCDAMMHANGDEVRTSIYRAAVYQAAMRTSIRNLADDHPKQIQVVDRATARWLANLIDGAQVEKLPGNDPVSQAAATRPPPKTNKERQISFRKEHTKKLVESMDYLNGVRSNEGPYNRPSVTPESPPNLGSIFHSRNDQFGISTQGIPVTSFRGLLAAAHQDTISAKEDRSLISSAVFDPNLGDDGTRRGKVNIVSLSGIWLDNDGGDLSIEEFSAMLNVPMCIFNSYSSTRAQPKWRVWIPTTHLLSDIAHREMIDQIVTMLRRRGYYGSKYIKQNPGKVAKHHGFDEGKFGPASLFHLPAQAKNPKNSFFLEFNWDKPLLNPYRWIDRSIVDRRPEPQPQILAEHVELTEVNERKVAAATANWQAHNRGDGNRAFFALAVAYKHAGLDWAEAEPLLRQQAHYAHGHQSRQERLADLRNIRRKVWR